MTHPGLGVGEPPGVLELRAEAGLVLAQLRRGPLRLLRVVRQVAVLHSQLTAEGILVTSTAKMSAKISCY